MIRLRPATPGDIPVLDHWDTQPPVIAATGDDDRAEWAEEIATAEAFDWQEILIAELDGRPLGVLQIIDPAREQTHDWVTARPTSERSTSGSGRRTIWRTATARR